MCGALRNVPLRGRGGEQRRIGHPLDIHPNLWRVDMGRYLTSPREQIIFQFLSPSDRPPHRCTDSPFLILRIPSPPYSPHPTHPTALLYHSIPPLYPTVPLWLQSRPRTASPISTPTKYLHPTSATLSCPIYNMPATDVWFCVCVLPTSALVLGPSHLPTNMSIAEL